MDGWKMNSLLGRPISKCKMLVSGVPAPNIWINQKMRGVETNKQKKSSWETGVIKAMNVDDVVDMYSI